MCAASPSNGRSRGTVWDMTPATATVTTTGLPVEQVPALALQRTAGVLSLSELTLDGPRDIGTFADAAAAWKAIDALDMAALG